MAHTRKSVRGHGRGVTLLLFCWSTQGFVLPATHAQETDNEAREYARDGSLALEQKDFALAARNFQSALELDPGSAEAHSGLGIALRESGNPSGAISEFQKASRLEPKAWEPRYLLAQTFILLGDFKNAIGELRRVLQRRAGVVNLQRLLNQRSRRPGNHIAVRENIVHFHTADIVRTQRIESATAGFGLVPFQALLSPGRGLLIDLIDHSFERLLEMCRVIDLEDQLP